MKVFIASITCLLVHLISNCQTSILNPDIIISQLKTEKNNAIRMKLILQLADFSEAEIPVMKRKPLIRTLLGWYRTIPDAGVHSAIDYLFRYAKKGRTQEKLNWNLEYELEKIDKELRSQRTPARNWFLTSEGQTLVIIPGPVSFMMGSPESEEHRDNDEVLHRVNIPRSFSISTKEITVDQFQRFLDDNTTIKELAMADSAKSPGRDGKKLLIFSPDNQCPQILITWYEAAQYCNWLSKQEGIPENEWCYPSIDKIKSGMEMSKNHLTKTGYRLPTEAEWEFACRAGTTSSRFYGSSDELLSDYAWYSKDPPRKKDDPISSTDPHHTYPVGQLKPNPLGLFDMYGNVWEWCHSRRFPYSRGAVEDNEDIPVIITDSIAMVRRGGSFSYGKDVMRSAHRGATNYFPLQRRDNVGFRIARTLP